MPSECVKDFVRWWCEENNKPCHYDADESFSNPAGESKLLLRRRIEEVEGLLIDEDDFEVNSPYYGV